MRLSGLLEFYACGSRVVSARPTCWHFIHNVNAAQIDTAPLGQIRFGECTAESGRGHGTLTQASFLQSTVQLSTNRCRNGRLDIQIGMQG